jgi:outer membrane biosynthesis protein TonB
VKQGLLTLQFAIKKDRQMRATEITSSSGDDVLDREARDCVSLLKMADSFPVAFKGKELVLRMQLLYKAGRGVACARSRAAGSRG